MAGSPRSWEGGKVNSGMDALSEPGPLHLHHILRRHSQGDRAHTGPGKGDCPGESLTPDTQHPHSTQPPRAQWAVGWKDREAAVGFPRTPLFLPHGDPGLRAGDSREVFAKFQARQASLSYSKGVARGIKRAGTVPGLSC